MVQKIFSWFNNALRLKASGWHKRDRFAPAVIETPLLRDLQSLSIKSQNRSATERLPPTRPAEAHFGRRERVQHSIGRT